MRVDMCSDSRKGVILQEKRAGKSDPASDLRPHFQVLAMSGYQQNTADLVWECTARNGCLHTPCA